MYFTAILSAAQMKTTTCVLALFLGICADFSSALLRPQDELTPHCYHFPAKDFGKNNNIKDSHGASPKIILEEGDQAIDFTLLTPEVRAFSELLNPFRAFIMSEKSYIL
jgi:hypothetical protein